jgi:hypothetical protein
MTKAKQYYIDSKTVDVLIHWGLQNRPEGMKGAGNATMPQIRYIVNELLNGAKKQEKNLQPIIQTHTPEVIDELNK